MAAAPMDDDQDSGTRKAAIFLLGMGSDFSREVFARLPDKEIRLLAEHASRLSVTSRDDVVEVMKSFVEEFLGGPMPAGGSAAFNNLVSKALGESRAMGILSAREESNPISEVCSILSPPLLGRLVRREHPQTQAIILASLPAEQATAVLEEFPEDESADLIFRIGHLERVPADTLQQIADALEREILQMGAIQEQSGNVDAMKMAADVTANFPSDYSIKLLDRLEETDEDFANELRSRLFVFDDLLRLDSRTMQLILREADKDALLVALRGAPNNVRDHFFGNMSSRAADMMRDDIESMGPVRISDVENSQKEIVGVALRLEKEGALVLPRGDADEMV